MLPNTLENKNVCCWLNHHVTHRPSSQGWASNVLLLCVCVCVCVCVVWGCFISFLLYLKFFPFYSISFTSVLYTCISMYKPCCLDNLKEGIRTFWRTLTPSVCINHLHKVIPAVLNKVVDLVVSNLRISVCIITIDMFNTCTLLYWKCTQK